MKNLTLFIFVFATGFQAFGQNCPGLNVPAAIADQCAAAPFFCGNYLENYCGTNAGLNDDVYGETSGFIRLSPCAEDLKLEVSVSNCNPGGSGLIFRMYPENCLPVPALSSDTVVQNTTDTLELQNLATLENYLLAISGLQGSVCEFNIKVLEGIGTALPGAVDCFCTPDTIAGPKRICSHEAKQFSINPPACNLSFSLPIGGNGEFCPPASACPASLDSLIITWHIPSVMHFIGDSTGFDVTIALDSNYFGLDTLRFDSIWVIWTLVSSTPQDSLVFCACSDISCSSGILKNFLIIGWDIRNYFCTLTCDQPTCTIEGITYDSPVSYSYEPEDCVKINVTVTQQDPSPLVSSEVVCEGGGALLEVLNYYPDYHYEWDNGATGQSVYVSPAVSTNYQLTATSSLGNCSFTVFVFVEVLPLLQTNLGQIGQLSCTEPCLDFQGDTYCLPGEYTVYPNPCEELRFSIGFDPATPFINLPPASICEGDCLDFFGQQICSALTATHVQNCTTYVQQVMLEPLVHTQLGLVGSLSCATPCITFEGVSYCDTGTYTIPDGICGTKTFRIDFKKQMIDLGEIGRITCTQDCFNFEGTNYCQAGVFSVEDNCVIRTFSIAEETDLPVCSPAFEDCLPSNTHFTVGFSITGLPPFKINGAEIPGNYYLSGPQPNGIPYTFIVEQANGCQTLVEGIFNCAQFCNTNAGKLSAQTLHGCAGQSSVQVESIEAPTMASGDVQLYTLQDINGTIVSHNISGNFAFDPATMMTDVPYFAVLSIGPPDLNGVPDLLNACTDTSNHQPLIFHDLPLVSISGDSSLCPGGTLSLSASGAESYSWNVGTSGPILEIFPVEEINEGLYEVTGQNIWGCSDRAAVAVSVLPADTAGCCKLQLPNAFTPNGDGANDAFKPLLPDCNKLEFAEMRVYSRWGELVFKSIKDDESWDGNTPNGTPAGSDTYVFTFRYRLEGNEEITRKGEITLLR